MMDSAERVSSRSLYHQVSSLLLYQAVFENEVGQAFLNLLQTLNEGQGKLKTRGVGSVDCLQAYGLWFRSLAGRNQSWQDFIVDQILWDSNPFSDHAQADTLDTHSSSLLEAAKYDLKILQSIYHCTSEQISHWIKTASQTSLTPLIWTLESSRDNFLYHSDDWSNNLPELIEHYQQYGTGILGKYGAFRWHQNNLKEIPQPDPIQLTELVGYETQKKQLIQNTECLLSGYPALHVLLYGSRGSGKSSLIKSLLNQYHQQGLRLVEVGKSDLICLPSIIEQLRDLPQKFILFVDDLSFEEDDDTFKALKVALEGSLTARAGNVVVYATSNRRHLIREFFADRPKPSQSDEVHAWDTLQEKLSFSDRFGLTLTFEPINQDSYLAIVFHLAKLANITLDEEALAFRAKQWATRHNGRSGRTARQFIDYLQGEIRLNQRDES